VAWIDLRHRVTVPEISREFSVSLATARRDLEALASQGKVQRVHGGAIALRQAPPEPPVLLRTQEQLEEKRRIAAAAAALVTDGETIFLGSGTTAMEVARHLHGRQGLTVFTNSLLVVNVLADAPGVTLLLLGGRLRASELSLIGHLTEQGLADLRALKVIMGIRALDLEHGLTNAYLEEGAIDRTLLRLASEAIIVADHTKCERVSTVFVAPLDVIDTLVTDQATPAGFVEALLSQGIQVLVV
jgi:DeoR/GlpR family transcriptional regulator of sugar metabolism